MRFCVSGASFIELESTPEYQSDILRIFYRIEADKAYERVTCHIGNFDCADEIRRRQEVARINDNYRKIYEQECRDRKIPVLKW